MKKISKNELLAIIAATGVSSSTLAMASNIDNSNTNNALGKVEHSGARYLGEESKCGKGSCGKDEKGAAAAKKKKEVKKADKKVDKAEEKVEKAKDKVDKAKEEKQEKKEEAPKGN